MHEWARLDLYARFNARWFESARGYEPSGEHVTAFREAMPDGWRLERRGLWWVAEAPGVTLRAQGWKLHVTAPSARSTEVLRRALPHLLDAHATFKFLLDPATVAAANGKLWARAAGGKFITIYPPDDDALHALAERLTAALDDVAGPYVLSDRRWPGSAAVSYRYGGFRARPALRPDGTREMLVEEPGGGLVPDVRAPYWAPPAWIVDPFARLPGPAADGAAPALHDGRFLVRSALQYSNRGGVYRALDTATGKAVVLKESRPGIEIGRGGVDAVTVLRKEHRLLELLEGCGCFPRPLVYFEEQGHAFLAQEWVDGDHLGHVSIRRHPVYHGSVTAAGMAAYLEAVRTLWSRVALALAAAHERGVALGDLSPTNIIVSGQGWVRLIDLESAVEDGVDAQLGLQTRGYAAPSRLAAGVADAAGDRYGLGAVIFMTLMVANGFVALHPPGQARFLAELKVDLGLSDDLVALVNDLMRDPPRDGPVTADLADRIAATPVTEPTGRRAPRLAQTASARRPNGGRATVRRTAEATCAGFLRYLDGTATPERDDRLFPADLAVFETNPVGVAHGAAGVLHAVRRLAGAVPDAWMRWLVEHDGGDARVPPGLYVGRAGVAWVLGELGQGQDAARMLRAAVRHPLLHATPDVLHGAAGVGLACLRRWADDGDKELLDAATAIGRHLHGTATFDARGASWPDEDGDVPLGYARGASGIAGFLLSLHLATGDQDALALGRSALAFDLQQAIWRDGQLVGFPWQMHDEDDRAGVVARCYWDHGSAGVGTTLLRYHAVTGESELVPWIGHVVDNVARKYAVFPQLFHGLAGLGNMLLDAWELSGDDAYLTEIWEVAGGVLLFRAERPEGVTFPGEQALRESADFATGGAGVALFLRRLLDAQAGHVTGNFNFVVDQVLPSRRPRPELALAAVRRAARRDAAHRPSTSAGLARL